MQIRDRSEADLPACLELLSWVCERDGYPLHLAPGEVGPFLRSEYESGAWVAGRGGRIVGHVALHCRPQDITLDVASEATGLPNDRLAMVSRLFVAPDARRVGVARALLRHASAEAQSTLGRRAVLDVGQTLHKAVALYESEGWSRVGELHLPLAGHPDLDLWVYVSPESDPV